MFDSFKKGDDLIVGKETTQTFIYTNPKDADAAQLIVADPEGRIVEAEFMRRFDQIETSFVPYMEGNYKIFETKFGYVKYLNSYETY